MTMPDTGSAVGGMHHVEHVMGMPVSIDIRDREVPADAIGEVIEWLHHVDATFSTYDDTSPISAMGRGELSFGEATDEIRDVLRLCEAVRVETDGAFDVLEVPAPNGTRLDPSGLVKGWSIERAAAILESHGCANFCLNAGGDIAIRGCPSSGASWRVGIRHPTDDQSLAFVVEAQGRLAIATSATYERGPHIVDPREGRSTTVLISATVVGPDLGIADAYATAVFVMGFEGLDWIESRSGYEAYVITHDAMTYWSSGFPRAAGSAAQSAEGS